MFLAMAKTCQTKEGASDVDLQQLMQRELPSTHTAKCLHTCIMESIGLIENGKPSVESSIELAKVASDNNAQIVKLTKEVAEECATVSDHDRCEMAFKMITCSMEATKQRGFDPKLFLA